MARIDWRADADIEQIVRTVRETFESRDYLWEQTDAETAVASEAAVASEGDASVTTAALPVSQRLTVGIRVDVAKRRLLLTQESLGAAYSAAGGGWVAVQLAARFRKLVGAVRADLDAAALR